MTACVNKNHGRRVAGVVTASLVGALTLGGVSLAAVPTVALAEQGSLQDAWSEGATLAGATDGKGATATAKDGKYTFATGSGKYLVPTVVKSKFGDTKYLTDTTKFTFSYQKADGTGTPVANTGESFAAVNSYFGSAAAGTYKVTVTNSDGFSFEAFFSLEDRTLDGAKVAGSVTYSGKDLAKSVSVTDKDGNALSLYDATKNPGGEYTIAEVDGAAYDATTNALVSAGSHKITLQGQNGYKGTVTLDVTVDKLDLAKAALTVDDFDGSAGAKTVNAKNVKAALKLNGDAFSTELGSHTGIKSVSGPDNKFVYNVEDTALNHAENNSSNDFGPYTVVVKAKDNDKNVTGEATVSFTHYEKAAGTAQYGNEALAGHGAVNANHEPADAIVVDLTAGESFDASRLAFKNGRDSYKGEVTVKYYKGGKEVDASALKEPGTYLVTMRATPVKGEDGKWVGGSASAYFQVKGNELYGSNDLAFYVNGTVADGNKADVLYDGSDQLKAVTAKVVDPDGKAYEAGKDFELVATNDADNKEVTSITEEGNYTVKVKPLTFAWAAGQGAAELKLTVVAVDAHDGSYEVKNADGSTTTKPASGLKDQKLVWTGSELAVPQAQYLVYKDAVKGASASEVKLDDDNEPVYADLATDLYNVVSIYDEDAKETVESIKDAHTYTVTVATSDKAGSNYALTDHDFTVTVKKAKSFADVDAAKWYAGSVEKAFQNFYINGTSGTQLFSPEANITRADAVGILFNMAGGAGKFAPEDFRDEDGSYATGFSDVDGHVYYAQALAWAHKVGVANGNGDGTFSPDAKLTREQFAAFLMNYAKASGKYEAPATDELSKLPDASGVDAWARDAVNWAVSNKVLGNGGYVAATSNITRAEVAAMGVNFQPKPLVDSVNGVKPGERTH